MFSKFKILHKLRKYKKTFWHKYKKKNKQKSNVVKKKKKTKQVYLILRVSYMRKISANQTFTKWINI